MDVILKKFSSFSENCLLLATFASACAPHVPLTHCMRAEHHLPIMSIHSTASFANQVASKMDQQIDSFFPCAVCGKQVKRHHKANTNL